MKWYKIVGVPFIRQDVSDPWSILLRDNCSLKMIYVNNNDALEAYVAINDSSYETLEAELKRTNYLFQKSNECLIENKIDILRKIDRIDFSNAIYHSIKSDQNGMRALLQHLCNNHGGVCIEINGKHTMSPQLQSQIVRIKRFINFDVCPFIEDISNAYNFNIFAFSDDIKCSNSIADKMVSSFEGMERNSCIMESSPFVDEVARIITNEECNHLMSITNLLGDFGIQHNNDTLIGNNSNAQLSNNSKDVDIVFGTNFSGGKSIGISKKELCQHVFIAGGTGSGKGNLLINLAMQFYHNGISFLIIESAKNELHHLSKWISKLKVWRPETGKFVLDPFYLPEGLEYVDYESNLIEIMNGFFNVDPDDPDTALPALYLNTLKKCRSKFINNPFSPTQFGIAEFMVEFANLERLEGYDKTIEKRLRAAGLNRTASSITNDFVLDSNVSIPIQELINGFNVLQLEPALKTDLAKSRFAFVLLNQILAVLQKKETQELNLVIIIDESHVLIKNTDECKIGTYFHKMIDEFRSKGISIIVSDQSANNIPSGIVNESYTKIFLGGNDKTGIINFRSKAKLDDLAYENLFSLTSGQGILICDNNSAGITFTTKNLIEDLKINEFCEYQNSYLKNNRITIETYRECKSCIYKGICRMRDKEEAKRYADHFYDLYYAALVNAFVDKDTKNLNLTIGSVSYEELLKKIYEITSKLSDVMFGCCLKQVFRKFNIDHGNNECFNKYDELINNIIANRYAIIYYNTHKELLRKAITVKDEKIHITKGPDDELLKTICEGASILSDDIFHFYLERVFKRFNSEYGDGVNDDKYNKLISVIITKRHFYERKKNKN